MIFVNFVLFIIIAFLLLLIAGLIMKMRDSSNGTDIGDMAKEDIDIMLRENGIEKGNDSEYYELDELLKVADNLEKEVLPSMYNRGIKIKRK